MVLWFWTALLEFGNAGVFTVLTQPVPACVRSWKLDGSRIICVDLNNGVCNMTNGDMLALVLAIGVIVAASFRLLR